MRFGVPLRSGLSGWEPYRDSELIKSISLSVLHVVSPVSVGVGGVMERCTIDILSEFRTVMLVGGQRWRVVTSLNVVDPGLGRGAGVGVVSIFKPPESLAETEALVAESLGPRSRMGLDMLSSCSRLSRRGAMGVDGLTGGDDRGSRDGMRREGVVGRILRGDPRDALPFMLEILHCRHSLTLSSRSILCCSCHWFCQARRGQEMKGRMSPV